MGNEGNPSLNWGWHIVTEVSGRQGDTAVSLQGKTVMKWRAKKDQEPTLWSRSLEPVPDQKILVLAWVNQGTTATSR